MFKIIIALSALVAASVASPVVSGDYGSVGVQSEQTIRGALNTLSSYSKAINTAHSQAYVSRTDYTSNPGIVAAYGLHPAVAPVAAAYHAPLGYPAVGGYHAPLAAAYHAPYASPYAGKIIERLINQNAN